MSLTFISSPIVINIQKRLKTIYEVSTTHLQHIIVFTMKKNKHKRKHLNNAICNFNHMVAWVWLRWSHIYTQVSQLTFTNNLIHSLCSQQSIRKFYKWLYKVLTLIKSTSKIQLIATKLKQIVVSPYFITNDSFFFFSFYCKI